MAEELYERDINVNLESPGPLRVVDSDGKVIGSARLIGMVQMKIVLDRNHPESLDLETDNGLARLSLYGLIEDNVVHGTLTINPNRSIHGEGK